MLGCVFQREPFLILLCKNGADCSAPFHGLFRFESTGFLQIGEPVCIAPEAAVFRSIHALRVSEVKYITVEALACGKAEISLKGKIRTILIPGKLCKKLKKYAKKKRTVSGEIFITKNGTGLSRKQIWAEMKAICQRAKVAASKVFPHNLRHLFARTFYKVCRDVAKLADVLGHSSIETTRIYLISTGKEHNTILDKLRLTT